MSLRTKYLELILFEPARQLQIKNAVRPRKKEFKLLQKVSHLGFPRLAMRDLVKDFIAVSEDQPELEGEPVR